MKISYNFINTTFGLVQLFRLKFLFIQVEYNYRVRLPVNEIITRPAVHSYKFFCCFIMQCFFMKLYTCHRKNYYDSVAKFKRQV